jgi:hypothetical protein
LVPACAVRILKPPLLVDEPAPVMMEIEPPVPPDVAELSPTLIITRPAVMSPGPTITLTLPAAPLVAAPVSTVIDPLVPLLVVPELK